jgi:prophage maintenance system killer protein
LVASEAEAVSAVMALANGEIDEAGFSDWLKDNSLSQ